MKFKGDFNVVNGEVKPAMSSIYCSPEYEVWDIRGLLTENGITPNEVTLEDIILPYHTKWLTAANELMDLVNNRK